MAGKTEYIDDLLAKMPEIKETGGSAFPQSGFSSPDGNFISSDCGGSGLTVRDYFAAKAMQGILANPAQLDNVNDKSAEWVSRDAYLVADAMLKARG